jgi:uncharacterized repeat protein (TIGR03803 family)
MRSRKFSNGVMAVAIAAVGLLCAATLGVAQQEKVLHNFVNSGNDGFYPSGNLILDSAGNIYGTTSSGYGQSSYGTVFELTPGVGGIWTEKVLYSFTKRGDVAGPIGGLTSDAAGNLYGTTFAGGAYNFGGVFQLTPTSNGGWTEKVLHSFSNNGFDGVAAYSAVVIDASGNLYGTTAGGGGRTCPDEVGCGIVFELTPNPNGNWSEKVLHAFPSSNADGSLPYGGLLIDSSGNLYGMTSTGGAYGNGAVFEMMPGAGGQWSEKVLHSFRKNGIDGQDPFLASLILDHAGNLYGTTSAGGAFENCSDGSDGCGTVFELTPGSNGQWDERVLHSFSNNGKDGYFPRASLFLSPAGNLYGTASTGGSAIIFLYGGTAFELSLVGGSWTQKTLHSFGGGTDGAYPGGGLISDSLGNLYGTTQEGGPAGYGTVFEIKP